MFTQSAGYATNLPVSPHSYRIDSIGAYSNGVTSFGAILIPYKGAYSDGILSNEAIPYLAVKCQSSTHFTRNIIPKNNKVAIQSF